MNVGALSMPISCWACEETAETLSPGWALRGDELVASCPDHVRYMPPHPGSVNVPVPLRDGFE